MKKPIYFKKGDIVLYGVVILFIALSFFVFVFDNKKTSALTKLEIYYYNELIFEYSFADGGKRISETENAKVRTEEKDSFLLVFLDLKQGKNVLKIEKDKAYMIEADCGIYGECIRNFKPITGGGQVIICMPHGIKVLGIGEIDGERLEL